MSIITSVIAGACLLVVASGSSWPAVDPAFRQIRQGGTHTAICRFGLALSDCQIHVYEPRFINQTLDFSRGVESATYAVTYADGEDRASSTYAGSGLASGECGVHFSRVNFGMYLVQCAGKLVANGSWATGFTLLQSTIYNILPVNVATPRYILAAAGSDVSVQLDAGWGTMDSCGIITPSAGWEAAYEDGGVGHAKRYRFVDAGIRRGQCNWTLTALQTADAGLWKWWGWRTDAVSYQVAVVAVVTLPRGWPVVHVASPQTLFAGDVVEATCSAPPAVPPSELTWLLDGVIIRKDTAYETLEGDLATWTLPWEPRPVRQTLRRLLTTADIGKTLECRAKHVAEVDARTDGVLLGVVTKVELVSGNVVELSP